MELICTQPGFKACNEPLNLRNPAVSRRLGISRWEELQSSAALPALERYFRAICDGESGFKNPVPFSSCYRPVTSRIVFKIIHGGEAYINWFKETFNGRIVYLLRHPIPVTLSRQVLPRLHAFLNSEYRHCFTEEQLDYARSVVETGDKFEQGILLWCLQNGVALQQVREDWTIVTYEQLVLEPEPVINLLADRLDLPAPEKMTGRLTKPSGSSTRETKESIQGALRLPNRQWLVEKWLDKVTEAQRKSTQEMLEVFRLDVYSGDSVLPADRLWIQS